MSSWNQANPRYRRPQKPGAHLRSFLASLLAGGDRLSGRSRLFVLIFLILLILGLILWQLRPVFRDYLEAPEAGLTPPPGAPAPPPAMGPQFPSLPPLPEGSWSLWADYKGREIISETAVPPGGTVSQSLENLGLSRGQSQNLIRLLDLSQLLGVIQPGAVFKAFWRDPRQEENDLLRVEFAAEPGRRPLVFQTGGEDGFFLYDLASKPRVIRLATQAQVEDTFWGAGEKAGLEPKVILQLTDLLAAQIDFVSDIRSGDSFQLLFRGLYQEGRLTGTPEIEMIRMTNGEDKYEFYRHENRLGGAGWYDVAFRSIYRTFFKSPLQFTRISSGFTQRRLHPILKTVRPHLGVDYAAPSGTPVSAVAGGTVEFAGRQGGYGLLVILRHGETYQTMYGHLSRIAPGIRKNAEVEQGSLLGYVGATGLATGPHLDFRLKKNNEFVDPLPEMARQEGRPLPSEERAAFSEEVTAAQTRLKELLSWDNSL
ncbi:MAG: M23 family metallopeptidase [Deltaproteobacteria bacterium]|jgi:murein DD-endopeptidase MepM/ murein hydrolase activator NlpD|nr:M23 family metallopeptidase [Deltaproteobacteria bacterium]